MAAEWRDVKRRLGGGGASGRAGGAPGATGFGYDTTDPSGRYVRRTY